MGRASSRAATTELQKRIEDCEAHKKDFIGYSQELLLSKKIVLFNLAILIF